MNNTDLLDLAFASLVALCETLSPDDWTKPTDCPGWSVQDNVSHQIGMEWPALGRPTPAHDLPDLDHVKTPAQARNEVAVDYRRSWPPDRVLAELGEVAGVRVRALRDAGDDGGELISIRAFDCWMHEQDIRCATARTGHLEGPLVRAAVERCLRTIPMIVGKRVAPPDGTTVVLEVTGPEGATIALEMRERRAVAMDRPPADPDARLSLDVHALTRLGGGRQPADRLTGHVALTGDAVLAARIMEAMSFTP